MAIMHTKGIHSACHPNRHLCTSLRVVYQLGRGPETKHLQRPGICKWILYKATCFRTRGCSHDRITDLSLERLLRKPIRTHAPIYTPTRSSRSRHATTFSVLASHGRSCGSQRRPPECAHTIDTVTGIIRSYFLRAIVPPLPRKQVCSSLRR